MNLRTPGCRMRKRSLCVTLKNAKRYPKAIANQMYSAQQPNVFLASPLPANIWFTHPTIPVCS